MDNESTATVERDVELSTADDTADHDTLSDADDTMNDGDDVVLEEAEGGTSDEAGTEEE